MTIRATLIALIGSIAFGPAAGAQTEQPQQLVGLATRYVDPVAGVGIERAITQALEQEPSLRATRSEVNVARGMRVQAGLRPNPSMTFSQQQEPTGRGNQTRIEFVWPLDLFRKASRVSVAERQIDATRSAVWDEERLLAADVRMHYGNVAAAVRELTVLDDVFDAVSGQLVLVTARVDVGATPPLERDLLSVELQRLESERLVQAGVAARALVDLKRIMGMAADVPLVIRDGLEDLVDRETGAQLPTDSAARIQRRSDVESALARERVAEAQVEQARPDRNVHANAHRLPAEGVQRCRHARAHTSERSQRGRRCSSDRTVSQSQPGRGSGGAGAEGCAVGATRRHAVDGAGRGGLGPCP